MRTSAPNGIIALEHDKDYIPRKLLFKVGKLFLNKPLVDFKIKQPFLN